MKTIQIILCYFFNNLQSSSRRVTAWRLDQFLQAQSLISVCCSFEIFIFVDLYFRNLDLFWQSTSIPLFAFFHFTFRFFLCGFFLFLCFFFGVGFFCFFFGVFFCFFCFFVFCFIPLRVGRDGSLRWILFNKWIAKYYVYITKNNI